MSGHDPFDPKFVKEIHDEVFGPILEHYFRPKLIGAEKLAKQGPILLAPNHSGNAFPYDGMVLDIMLWKNDAFDPKAKFRSVFEKELAVTWWMRPFGIDNFWRLGGGIDLTFDNFDRILDRGERMIYYPEGVPGIGKGFNNRYQLQRFSSSFVYHTARHKTPVYPVHIINAEWIIPFCYTFRPIDWFMEKFLGVPFLPLPGALFGFLFPSCWYLALPVQMTFVIGDPIDTHKMCQDRNVDLENADFDVLRDIAQEIKRGMQKELDGYVKEFGKKPYDVKDFLKRFWKNKKHRASMIPIFWPYLFLKHVRGKQVEMPKSRLMRWLKNWDIIGFFLPLGWPILSLTRAFRKPPFGYRGLSKKQRKALQGEYHWHLKDRPLPKKE